MAVLHLAVIALFSELFQFVWLYVACTPVLIWLHQRDQIPPNCLLLFLAVTGYLLAEPAVGIGLAVILSFIPFLHVVRTTPPSRYLLLQGMWAGWLIGSGIYAWILPTLTAFFGSDAWRMWPVFLALTGVMGIQIGVFLWTSSWMANSLKVSPFLAMPIVYALCEFWLSLPMGIHLPLAFVWNPFWIQALDLFGIGGVTVLMVLVGCLIGETVLRATSQSFRGSILPFCSATLIVIVVAIYGTIRSAASESTGDGLPVSIVQSVSPLRIQNRDLSTQEEVASRLLELSLRGAAESERSVIIWPEGAASFSPTNPAFNLPYMAALKDAQRTTSSTVVAHGVDFERDQSGALQYRSAIFAVEPVGEVTGVFHKQILMPFGEYLPLESRFPILRRWLPDARSILSGGASDPLTVDGVRLAPVICYEVLFPRQVAELCRQDVGGILILTNDRWYGTRQQPPQHLGYAVLRAIENRKPVIRGAHSGISAIIQQDGQIRDGEWAGVEEITVLSGTLQPTRATTLYTRVGDILPRYVLPFVLLLGIAYARMKGRDSQEHEVVVQNPTKRGKKR